jgi:phage baseplate assembly protein W
VTVALLGNTSSHEFHDLTRVKPQCHTAALVASGHAHSFSPDTLAQALREGYEPCGHCLGTVADLLIGALDALVAPAGLTGRDLGNGRVSLTWTYPSGSATADVRFDVYASRDPFEPFRTIVLLDQAATTVALDGFAAGGDVYFVVVARRGGLLSLPSNLLHLLVAPVLDAVVPSASGAAASAQAPGFPFGVDGAGRVFADGGDSLLHGKVLQLLLTAPGERVNLPEFGTRLRDLVFDPNNEVLAAATEFAVSRALERYLGDELQVDSVAISNDDAELNVEVQYLRKADLLSERLRIGIPIPR